MSPRYSLETFLYIRSDADLIRTAGEILGTKKLNLTLAEAVETIREWWEARETAAA